MLVLLPLFLAANPIVDLERLQGEWTMVQTIQDGKPKEARIETVLRIKDDNYTFDQLGKEAFKGKVALDGKTLELQNEQGKKLWRFTWTLDGDTLTLIFEGEKSGSVFKRKRKS